MKMTIPSKTIRTIGSILLSLLMLGIGLDFMLYEGVKLGQVQETLAKVAPGWLYLGIAFSLGYIWLHGLMYRQSFRVLDIQVSTGSMVKLFLKRNFVSIFLPAGFLSSQAFFSQEVVRTEQVKERELFAASGIFVTAGLLSSILLVVPALGWLLTQHILPNGAIEAFLSVSVFFFGILWAIWSFVKHGKVYHWCQKYLPALAHRLDTLDWSHFDLRFFIQTIFLSCLVELTGVFHVFIAARALGVEASVAMAFAGYLAVLVVLLTSPFLRGVGAVEALMALVLAHFGLSPLAAVSVAVLFRFFEFWLTLLLAIPVFIFRPLLPQVENPEWAKAKARQLIQEYGKSSLDYFKIYADKKLFFPKNEQSFLAYKNTSRYALVLDNPVAPNEQTIVESISEFDRFCQRNGLRSMYYRLPEASVGIYRSMGKIVLPIGQEAILPLADFSLEGRDKKALRNAVNRVERDGFVFVAHEAPQSKRLLQQLRAVSDEWLKMYKRSEMNFSQGSFDENELKNQVLLTLEDAEGKIYAFINLVPGANPQEANFDLMRRTQDAPSGTMDFMFVNMFLYLQSKGYTACNLGLVPMSGLEHGKTMSEKVLNQAYTLLPQFANFKSLRFFKDKFNPVWETRYVACNSQLDVLNLPIALDQVERRVKKAS